MLNPDEFMVLLGDFGTQVDLGFRKDEGADRVRWGCRLTPGMAAELGRRLIEAAGGADPQKQTPPRGGVAAR